MLIERIQQRRFRDKAGDDGADGGAGGEGDKGDKGAQTDPKLEQLQKRLEEHQQELERYKAKHQEAEKHRKAAEKKAIEQAEEAARKSGDVEALEKSWQEKLSSRETELAAERDQYRDMVRDLTAGQSSATIASELAVQGSARVLEPHIRSRLTTEYRDGKPTTVVLDKDGKPSAQTLDELKQEIRNDPAFAPLVVGSKASGAGGSSGKSSGASNTIARAELDKMSPKEKAAFYRKNPDVTIIDD